MSEVTVTFASIDEVLKVNKLLEARNKSSLRNRKKEVTRRTNRQELFLIDTSNSGDMFTYTVSVQPPVVVSIDTQDKPRNKPRPQTKEELAKKKLIRRVVEEVINQETTSETEEYTDTSKGQVRPVPRKVNPYEDEE